MITHNIEFVDEEGNVYSFGVGHGLVWQAVSFYGTILDINIVSVRIVTL